MEPPALSSTRPGEAGFVDHVEDHAEDVRDDPLAPGGSAWRGAEPGRLHYVGGLDGLRAIAVVAVLLYHAGLSGELLGVSLTFPGGFLGVEVFFVVSGYLITSLLLSEWRGSGGVHLGNFWLRRARRLLPALFLLLATVMVVVLLFYPDEMASLRGDVLASVFYVTNWNFIIADTSYFEAIGRPPLVQHLWSLAVEEQFYLLWPLIFTVGMRRLGASGMQLVVLAGAALSALLMFSLVPVDPTDASVVLDPSRVFMGTDTRASALLIGCALAYLWPQWRLRAEINRTARRMLDLAGFGALAGLVVMFATVGQYQRWLYPFGFLLCSVLTAVVIATVMHPAANVGVALGGRTLRWVGIRSYGIYLWHWPIFMITRPGADVTFAGLSLFAVRFGATFGIAALSYRYVEQPIREGALGRLWADYRSSTGERRQLLQFRVVGGAAVAVALLGAVTVGAINAQPPDRSYLLNIAAGEEVVEEAEPLDLAEFFEQSEAAGPPPIPPTTPTTAPPTTAAPDPEAAPAPEPPPEVTTTTESLAGRRIVFLGDSVMLGARNTSALTAQFPEAAIDAAQNRQVSDGIAVLQYWSDAGWLAGIDTVVVHLGTNGTFTDTQFDQIMSILAPVPKVLFVNSKVPQRPWEATNNAVIAAGVARHSEKAVLVDWFTSSVHAPEYFYDDGTHLNPAGAQRYAQIIRNHL